MSPMHDVNLAKYLQHRCIPKHFFYYSLAIFLHFCRIATDEVGNVFGELLNTCRELCDAHVDCREKHVQTSFFTFPLPRKSTEHECILSISHAVDFCKRVLSGRLLKPVRALAMARTKARTTKTLFIVVGKWLR